MNEQVRQPHAVRLLSVAATKKITKRTVAELSAELSIPVITASALRAMQSSLSQTGNYKENFHVTFFLKARKGINSSRASLGHV
jgi:hypothetical protein